MGTFCCGTSLTAPARTGLADCATPDGPAPVPAEQARAFAPVRTKLWELPEVLHCSVVGTCLSTPQVHKLLSRLGLMRQGDTDHVLHGRAVAMAGQQTANARLLHRLLDTTHAAVVRSFARAGAEAALRRMWMAAAERGDIPGPYWAVLTHPACSYGLRQEVFGRVHMLSHLVGAANRADLRRLAELEGANARLQATVERQQARLQEARLQEAAASSQRTMQALQDAPSRQAAPVTPVTPVTPVPDAETQALQDAVQDLRRRLDTAERRSGARHARLADAQAVLAGEQATRGEAERRTCLVLAELAAAEAALAGDDPAARLAQPRLDGVSLLYVGGRPHAVAVMQGLARGMGARFAHHDGGMEDAAGLLPGLVGRADLVLFPVDCVSHEAALAIKRLCRHGGKTLLPLRSAGVGSFLAALRLLPAQRQSAA